MEVAGSPGVGFRLGHVFSGSFPEKPEPRHTREYPVSWVDGQQTQADCESARPFSGSLRFQVDRGNFVLFVELREVEFPFGLLLQE